MNETSVLFAGGIHDALSTSMVASLSASLLQKGLKVGVLMGTAYLFTQEAVDSGAILPRFQEVAQQCTQTQTVHTAPGHATRCASTPYIQSFENEKSFI